jgi:L-ribulose-5-phosphate 4-epimerase
MSPPGVPPELKDDVQRLREEVCALHAELTRWGLVTWTSGNVSARVPGADLLVIKPSGVSYDDLTPAAMSSPTSTPCSSRATTRRPATPRPTATCTGTCPRSAASSTPTARTPRRGPRGASRSPCVLTAMADEFGGDIPIGRSL